MPESVDHQTLTASVSDDLRFDGGGPSFRLMQRVGIIEKGSGPSVIRRSVIFVLIAWLPLLLLAIWEGDALGATPRTSLLLDFAVYARIFVAVPLIFAIDVLVGPRLREAGLRFIEGGLLRSESYAAFLAAAGRVRQRRESVLAEVALAVFALAAAWFLTIEQMAGLGARDSIWGVAGGYLLPAGMWYRAFTVPLVQFLLLRWAWHWVIWALFLGEVSRLRLNLLPTHSDRAAGLGFLGNAHVPMAVLAFATSCIICGELAFRIQFEGLGMAGLQALLPLLLAYLLLVQVLTFGPLLVFVDALAKARRDARRCYGMLVQQHNQLFHDKWIAGRQPPEESPLASPDMSSLVDLGSSFAVIQEMRSSPVGRRQMLLVAGFACAPGLPLIFLALPIAEAVRLLLTVLV